jgi:hypothetical protein
LETDMSKPWRASNFEYREAQRRMARLVCRLVDAMPQGNAPLANALVLRVWMQHLVVAEGSRERGSKNRWLYMDRAVHASRQVSACLDQILTQPAPAH